MSYRFDELGWLQFKRLAEAVLDLDIAWEERGYGWVGIVPEGAVPPTGAEQLEPATLVVVAWLRFRRDKKLQRLVPLEVERWPTAAVGSVLVLSNVPAADVPGAMHVGPERLGQLLDARPDLRLRVPFVLGIRDLSDLLPADLTSRSTVDLAAATDLARVFVPTRAYEHALGVLREHHFAVLTGPPEMGKTAAARTIALAQLTAGWEAHECIRPEDLWAAYARDRRQVFVADDAFGSTEYRPDAAERWALDLDRVLRAMDERHWLVWTSRPAPLKAALGRTHREHGVERWPRPAEVQVDAAALGVDEKALILYRHAKAAELPHRAVEVVRAHGWDIVSHEHFTPERIRRFVGGRLLELGRARESEPEIKAAVRAEIREPTVAMAASFQAVAPEHRTILVALLDTPPGPVSERELAAAVRRHSEGFARTPAELVDRLTDHFLRVVPPTNVTWVHPSWRDLVIAQVATDTGARRRFLERCGIDGLLLSLSVAGGVGGERILPLLRDDSDWDLAAERTAAIVPLLDDPTTIRLLTSLEAALDAELSARAAEEVAALAAETLARIADVWDAAHAVLAVSTLEAWFALARKIAPHAPVPPQVAPTWIELVPTDAVDITSSLELAQFDDWLALVQVLASFAPESLKKFGFPKAQWAIMQSFAEGVALFPPEAEVVAERALRRLRRLGVVGHHAAVAEQPDPWFEVRFETHSRRPEPAPSDRSLVERVLRDLS